MPKTTCAILLAVASLGMLCTPPAEAVPSETSSDSPLAETATRRSEAYSALAAGDAQRVLDLLKRPAIDVTEAERKSLQGRANCLLGNFGVARRKLQSAIRSRPQNSTDHYWLGRVYLAAGAPALAAAAFEKAQWLGLETADLRHDWAKALSESGHVLGKISRQPWTTRRASPPALGEFALGGLVVGHFPDSRRRVIVAPADSALYQISRALQIEPQRAESQLLAGELWAAAKQHAQAVRLFEQAETGLRGDALARCEHAWAESALTLGDLDGYLRHARKELEAISDVDSAELAACYDRAAREAAGRGDLARQVRYLLFAVELRSDVDRLLRLADALTLSQRTTDARRYLRLALDQGPSPSQRRAIHLRLQDPVDTSLARSD